MKKKSKLELDLLALLEEDSTLTDEEMAMMLNSDAKSVREAIENLEKDKSIVKYIAVVNRENLDDDKVEALIELKVTPQRDIGYDDIAKRIYRYSEIKGVYLMAGAYDLAVRMESDSIKNISKFVFEKLAVIDGVTSTQTVFIMRKYKEFGVELINNEQDGRDAISL